MLTQPIPIPSARADSHMFWTAQTVEYRSISGLWVRPSTTLPPRVRSQQIDRVIEGLNEGVRILRKLQGRPFRRLSLGVQKRRRAAAELVKAVGDDAWKVARNVPLHPHYRGDNDRQTEYLDISFPGILSHPESIFELCSSEDPREFETRLSAALSTRRSDAPGDVEAETAPASLQQWRDRIATRGT